MVLPFMPLNKYIIAITVFLVLISFFSLIFLSWKHHIVVVHKDMAYDCPLPSIGQVCVLMLNQSVPSCCVVSAPPSACQCVRRIEEERAPFLFSFCTDEAG